MQQIDHLRGKVKVRAEQITDAGVKKEKNEDCIGLRVPEEPLLTTKGIVAVVADGVSASEAGKEASETCVKDFIADYYCTPDAWTVKTSAHRVLTALNRWLYSQSQQFVDVQKGYISTMSVLIIKSRTAYIFHIGDSRIYRLRNNDFEQITKDHVAVINKNTRYLSRAMGMDVRMDIDYSALDVEEGDVFLLSTDGIHDFVDRDFINKQIVDFRQGGKDAGRLLIEQAKAGGSEDNLSCQILMFETLQSGSVEDAYKKLSELPFPPVLSPGMVLDGYRIEQEIHASTRSQLYLVTDTHDPARQKLVIKAPSINYDDDPAYIERLIMEPWIGQRIDSPHVVKVVEPKNPRTFLYYLVEYIEGQTLDQWLAEHKKPDVQVVVDIVDQVMKGLRAFHRRETLHQDLKPGNIVLDKKGLAKIIDFGACYVGGIGEISTAIKRDYILGTADYSAPEYRMGRKAEFQSDLFSLAVICYQMLTGEFPYGKKYAECNQYTDFLNLQYTPAYFHNPLVPVWMDGAIKKALNINIELRYRDISEFIYDLRHPNKDFLKTVSMPLVEQNPLLFWQVTSVVLMVALLLSWVYFLKI
ncbi:MAG TPA: protein kinase [Pseudomonadales bacterium]